MKAERTIVGIKRQARGKKKKKRKKDSAPPGYCYRMRRVRKADKREIFFNESFSLLRLVERVTDAEADPSCDQWALGWRHSRVRRIASAS